MHMEAEDQARGLWAAYAHGREPQLRERLVLLYLPFARMLAAKMYAGRTHPQVEFDDYLQFARSGLLQAVDRFDAGRGFKFETYAARRINGAILSGMENYSEVHEQVAARKRLVETRLASLQQSAPELSEPDALFGYLADLAIGLAVGFALEDSGMFHTGDDTASYRDNTYAGVELRQLRERLKSLVTQLPDKQRRVIACHYLQHMPFDEIAGLLQVSRGRIAQLHKEALLRLRQLMLAQPELDWSG
ncbi:sigma-70 family RNA polymerase sigma factor [Duganella sp. CY15W]|uniref:sigma-70 family RNA polymerase sigma factor n=1 Tax=Duganella sp. CY15W TaxID=2692172 RepID=UPI00136B188C|nr:sigma-70 family RNA polymerase sigma factor [Duganella sp. CY15W]